jgi:carboxyl-terminal processing protease
MTFKKEIKQNLGRELMGHYYLQRGEREYHFKYDTEINSALGLFKDMPRYQQILKGK